MFVKPTNFPIASTTTIGLQKKTVIKLLCEKDIHDINYYNFNSNIIPSPSQYKEFSFAQCYRKDPH